MWRIIAKALGEKAGKDNNEANQIALVRLLMFLSIFITNCFIVANSVRHWNDNKIPKCETLKSNNPASNRNSRENQKRI